MKCKYYETKLSFSYWLVGLGVCAHCQYEIEKKTTKKQRDDSNKFWEKQK